MFASLAALAAAFQTTSAAPAPAAVAAHCQGRDGWSDPAPPARIHGSTYYVGTCGISVILITGPAGHILIDSATAEAAPHVAANIERLGFRITDVRFIVSSHAHYDHVGGIAELQRRSGATVAARGPAVATLRTGQLQPGDPLFGLEGTFPPIRVASTLRDGEVVRVGPLRVTAHATPGHTPGSTSWSWRSCEGRACFAIIYADSVTAVAADSYRYSDHPAYVAAFRRSLARIGSLRCDLLLTPHPGASGMFERFANARLAGPAQCRDYAARAATRLDTRRRQERDRN